MSTLLQDVLYRDSAGELHICKNLTLLQQSVDLSQDFGFILFPAFIGSMLAGRPHHG